MRPKRVTFSFASMKLPCNSVGWADTGSPTSRDYRSTKVAGCKPPGGELFVRDAWVRCKTCRLRKRVFPTRVESVWLTQEAQPTRAPAQLGLKNQV